MPVGEIRLEKTTVYSNWDCPVRVGWKFDKRINLPDNKKTTVTHTQKIIFQFTKCV
jgi:hypothetical protein